MTSYQIHHLNFLKIAYNNFINRKPFTSDEPAQDDLDFIEEFRQLIEDFEAEKAGVHEQGEDFIDKAFRRYPELAHLIARDLLWYFGGNNLHNMTDYEIDNFQQLDEMRFAAEEQGETFDYINKRAAIFGQN
ncbi:PA2817 family protein [Neptuniibacter halophilus]|uniref:PA2817 family protein n=1 Tax=Neptuniibacter halophilus TaxID=651666 RepID=UPI0025735BC9|nr:PA2817 family protein [Neptuniibacter halophilus]